MNLEKVKLTALVQFPAIAKGNTVRLLDLELGKLDEQQLKSMASTLNGELIWIKLEGIYRMPEESHCITKDCYRNSIEESDQCEEHSYYNGIPLFNKDEQKIQS